LYKIVILGNHDLDYMMREEKVDPLIEGPKILSNAFVLNCQSLDVCGLKIYGIQWFWFNTWNFDYYDYKYKGLEKFDIPENTDILVTHGPPFGILDDYSGSKLLLSEITIKKPRYHLFGHMHSKNGCIETIWGHNKSTCFLNSASVCENSTKIVNKPTVINIFV
jgi:Icc-related predicted phosphoesterase